MKNLIILAKKHSSFLLIVLGALSIFLTNIILKKVLSPVAYGEYSIYITFFQLVSSFGLLGFEQVFLRISEVKEKGVIQTDKTLIVVLFTIWILFSAVGSYLFQKYFSEIDLSYGYFLLGTLSIAFFMFSYNAFRLNSSFVTSQLTLNLWKFLIIFLAIFFLWKRIDNIALFIKILTYGVVIVCIAQFYHLLKKLKFNFRKNLSFKSLNLFALHFFISLLTLTFIGYSDRFIVKSEFGSEALGEYFFLATIFFFPYALIQGYVGFKELVAFKEKGSLKGLNKKLFQINVLGIVMGVLIVLFSMMINAFDALPFINIQENKLLVLFFILTGIVKLNYSLLSALLGARGEIKTIRNANLQSLIAIAIIGGIFYGLFTSVLMVALAFLFFWISRALIWSYNLNKQFKEV